MTQGDDKAREVRQLLIVGSMYLDMAAPLRGVKRTYGTVLANVEKGRPERLDFDTIRWSSHLASACVRFFSLDECLGNSPRVQAYRRPQPDYVHVYLRDDAAHVEPRKGTAKRSEWVKARRWLTSLKACDAHRYAERVRETLLKGVGERFGPERIVEDASSWIKRLTNSGT